MVTHSGFCNKAKRCGECAGAHQTIDCPKTAVSCCNCGKTHRSWQKGSCPNFTAYKASVQRAKFELLERTAEIRREREPVVSMELTKPIGAITKEDQGFTLDSNHRAEGSNRGPGRPRKVQPATTTTSSASNKSMNFIPPPIPSSSSKPSKTNSLPMKDGEIYFMRPSLTGEDYCTS